MALSTVTTTFNVHDLFGDDFDPRRAKAWATVNVDTISDTSTGETRIGGAFGAIAPDGTGSFTHWAPGADGNPISWQTTYHFDVPDRTVPKGRRTESYGPFTVTASGLMTALELQQAVPPTYLSTVTALLDGKVDDAETARAGAESAAAASAASATTSGTSAAASEAARLAAEALVLSDLGTTDGQTRALIENPASQTTAALSVSIAAEALTPGTPTNDGLLDGFVPKTGTKVRDLTAPVCIPHGGAGKLMLPIGPIESARLGAAQGFDLIDTGDFRCNPDGGISNLHSIDLSTETNSQGNVWKVTTLQSQSATVRLDGYDGITGPFRISDARDAIREFGTNVATIPEIKTDGTGYPWAAGDQGTIWANLISSAGLQDYTLVTCRDLAELVPIIATGTPVGLLAIGDQTGAPALAALQTAWDAGVEWVVIDAGSNPTSLVATLNTIGFDVIIYTINRHVDVTAWVSAGVWGYYSDDPVYASNEATPGAYRRSTTTWSAGTFPVGQIAPAEDLTKRGSIVDGAWKPGLNADVNLLGQMEAPSPSGTYTYGWTVWWDILGSDLARHADHIVASSSDGYFNSSTPEANDNGYVCAIRPRGLNQFQIYEVVGATNTSKANQGPHDLVLGASGGLTSGVPVTSLTVVATTMSIAAGSKFVLPTGQTVTTSGTTLSGATTVNISSVTPSASVANSATVPTVLAIVPPLVLSSGLTSGDAITSLPVSAIAQPIASGAKFRLPTRQIATVSAAGAATGATSIPVGSITPSAAVASGYSLPNGAIGTTQVTPTTIVMTRTDQALTATATSSATRGKHFFAGQNNNSGTSGMRVRYDDFTIT